MVKRGSKKSTTESALKRKGQDCECDVDLHPNALRQQENLDPSLMVVDDNMIVSNEAQARTKGRESQRAHNQLVEERLGCTSCSCSNAQWDMHPGVIRMIENRGTAMEVEQLHRLERTMC